LNCRIDFWSSPFAWEASSKFGFQLRSVPTILHLLLISAFRHQFDLAQSLIFFAVALRTLLIAS